MTAAAPPTSLALPLLEALTKHTTTKATIRQTVSWAVVLQVVQVQSHPLTFSWWVPVVLQPVDDAVDQIRPGGLHRGQVGGPERGSQIGHRDIPDQRPLLKHSSE